MRGASLARHPLTRPRLRPARARRSRRGTPSPSPGARRAPVPARARSGRRVPRRRKRAPPASGCRRASRSRSGPSSASGMILTVPLVVDRFVLGAVQENCYAVRLDRGAPEAAVVDPGEGAAQLRLELAGMATRCAGILVTHCHWDHLMGVADLAEGTGAPVYAPQLELPVLEQPREFFPEVPLRPYADATGV